MSLQTANKWHGRDVIILAGGPSLIEEDVDVARKSNAHILCVNDTWRLVRRASAMYAADSKWWTTYAEAVGRGFCGQCWTCDEGIGRLYQYVHVVPSRVGIGLPEDKSHIRVMSTSTTQAMQLAYLWGAGRILLLGVDCKAGSRGSHWFGDHPDHLREYLPYDRWIDEFNLLAIQLDAIGLSVINCSRETALTCYPRMDIKDALTLCT